MIIFNGQISGKAETFFWKKARKLTITIMYITLFVFLPGVIVFAGKIGTWIPVVGYGMLFVLIPLITFIPKSNKEKMLLLPRKVYAEDEYISCVVGETEEYRRISDVTTVVDHGDFYELIFPIGKVSEKFICQKSLLTQGTLEEFESLFEDRVVLKTNNKRN